jgi:DNA-directed RNA polymerase alpha subunit
MALEKTLRICPNGHRYYKSSDCPVCPICENERKADDAPFATLGAPARRALENAGIATAQHLSQFSEKEILKLHGMGPGSLPKMREILRNQGLSFKTQ